MVNMLTQFHLKRRGGIVAVIYVIEYINKKLAPSELPGDLGVSNLLYSCTVAFLSLYKYLKLLN